MNTFERLLVVQGHDTHIDQLRHRRDTLPERAELEAQTVDLARIDAGVADADGRRGVLATRQHRLEDEVAMIEAKIGEVDHTLYKSGTITSPREAQALSDELASLKRRQRQLEDEVIELMEQTEPIDGELAGLAAERDELGRRIDGTRTALQASEALVDAELHEIESQRAAATAEIDETRLAEYEQLRKQLGGIAVARLNAGTCGGCNLTLSAVERDRIKNVDSDEAVYCEECGRLLVR